MSAGSTAARDALFINRITLRGPEMGLLHQHLLAEHGATRDEILSRFVPPAEEGKAGNDDVVSSALDALITLDLISSVGAGGYFARPLPAQLPFPTALLMALRKLTGRQGSVMDLYAWCVGSSVRMATEGELLDAARRHVPIDAGWTPQKIGLWASLGEYVGIITRYKGGLLIAPDTAALHLWLSSLLGGRERWAGEVFTEIDAGFAPCFTTARALHPGWAAALEVLQVRNLIRMELGSDAPEVLHADLGIGNVWSRIAPGTSTEGGKEA